MPMPFDVRDKNVWVVGAGRSGRAAAELLTARGAHVTLADTRTYLPEADHLHALGVSLDLGVHQPDRFASADLLVVSPGVPLDQEPIAAARRAGRPVIGEIEMASRWLGGRLIAITGTKGKSTTTTLTSHMLTEAGFDAPAGGNLGTPLSSQVDASRASSLHVVEVSSFQLETTDTFHPWISVLLNLSADHLDRHGTLETYGRAKARIFANQTADDWAVVNVDDPLALALAAHGRARRFDFGLDHAPVDGVTVERETIVRRDRGTAAPLVPLAAVKVPGRHILADVLAATAVGCLAGVPPQAMRRAIETFNGLEHALERVAALGPVEFVNDSKATNIEAARRAIESFDRGVVPILGGRFKGGRFEDLREAVQMHARAIVAIGEATPLIEQALGPVVPIVRATSMDEAVRLAYTRAQPEGVVLLAPACASFDMFTDYAARGRAFKDAVRRLVASDGMAEGGGGGR
jgi:UDP-N-acetylmuramoylalanine--D-glutamate ligase